MIIIIKLDDLELENISGGALNYVWIGIAISAAIIFISGIIDGIASPKECG